MLQETKLDNIDAKLATSVLGRRFNSWDYIGAQGSRGGILVGWSSDCLQHCGTIKKEFSISISFQAKNVYYCCYLCVKRRVLA